MTSFTLSEAVRGSEVGMHPRAAAASDRRGRDEPDDALPFYMYAGIAKPNPCGGGVDHYHLIFLLDIRLNRQGMMTLNQTVGSVIKRGGGRDRELFSRAVHGHICSSQLQKGRTLSYNNQKYSTRAPVGADDSWNP